MAPTADDDEHVRVRVRFEDSLRVMLVLRFSEDARARCERAKRELTEAQHRLIDAQEYMERTTVTLEQAIRLHARNRR